VIVRRGLCLRPRLKRISILATPSRPFLEQSGRKPDGLSSAEAATRLAAFGPNVIHGSEKGAGPSIFGQFRNPLVIILLIASALSAFTGDATSFFIIGTIVHDQRDP